MESESAELCGISGDGHLPVTKEEFNRLMAQVRYYHLRPLKQEISELKILIQATNEMMQSHVASDAAFFAKMEGAKWALWLIAGCLVPAAPLMYYMIRALVIAKVI